jgi:hypothetical protein
MGGKAKYRYGKDSLYNAFETKPATAKVWMSQKERTSEIVSKSSLLIDYTEQGMLSDNIGGFIVYKQSIT